MTTIPWFWVPVLIMYFVYLYRVRVPRKCNTLNIANNKIHHWLQDRQGNELYGVMIPHERGLKGPSLSIIFYLPILVLFGEKWLHELLGGGIHVVLDYQCKYINPYFGLFGFFSSFGSSFIHSYFSFLFFHGKGKQIDGGKKAWLVGCSNCWCIPSMNLCMYAWDALPGTKFYS